MRRSALVAMIAAIIAPGLPAKAEAARYVGVTDQRRAMTLVISGGRVTYFKATWGVSCFAVGRAFPRLYVDYSSARRGAIPVFIRDGRFRLSATLSDADVDRRGTHGAIHVEMAGKAGASVAAGYLLLELRLLAPDRRRLVDTCHTGRVDWFLRRARG